MKNCIRSTVTTLATAALLLAAATALAQPQDGNRPGGRRGFGPPGGFMGGPGGPGMGDPTLRLLRMEEVQKELELVDDQKEQLRKIADDMGQQMRQMFQGMADLSPEQRQAKFNESREKMQAASEAARKKVDEILLPHQSDRLKQLALQMQGTSALMDPKIQEELKFTEEQKQKLQAAREKFEAKMREMMPQRDANQPRPERSDAEREQRRKQFDDLRKAATSESEAVLTAAQKEQLENMKGKKFDFPQMNFGGRGGPGGRRGGDRSPQT